jgi:hypothetical protein
VLGVLIIYLWHLRQGLLLSSPCSKGAFIWHKCFPLLVHKNVNLWFNVFMSSFVSSWTACSPSPSWISISLLSCLMSSSATILMGNIKHQTTQFFMQNNMSGVSKSYMK